MTISNVNNFFLLCRKIFSIIAHAIAKPSKVAVPRPISSNIIKEISSELFLQEAEIQMKNCQLHWDDFIKNSSGPAQQAEIQQSRIDYLEQLINRQDEKIVNLSAAFLLLIFPAPSISIEETRNFLNHLFYFKGKNKEIPSYQ